MIMSVVPERKKGVSVFTENVTSLGKRLNQTKGSSKVLGSAALQGRSAFKFSDRV